VLPNGHSEQIRYLVKYKFRVALPSHHLPVSVKLSSMLVPLIIYEAHTDFQLTASTALHNYREHRHLRLRTVRSASHSSPQPDTALMTAQ